MPNTQLDGETHNKLRLTCWILWGQHLQKYKKKTMDVEPATFLGRKLVGFGPKKGILKNAERALSSAFNQLV